MNRLKSFFKELSKVSANATDLRSGTFTLDPSTGTIVLFWENNDGDNVRLSMTREYAQLMADKIYELLDKAEV